MFLVRDVELMSSQPCKNCKAWTHQPEVSSSSLPCQSAHSKNTPPTVICYTEAHYIGIVTADITIWLKSQMQYSGNETESIAIADAFNIVLDVVTEFTNFQ